MYSSDELLRNELSNITKFASWNGFSKQLTNKLLKSFTPKLPNNLSNDDVVTDPPTNPPIIWIHLPFIGKRGSTLIYHCTKKINRLLKQPAKFVTLWNTTNANAFLSTKDPTTKQHQSSVVYKFTCPGCSHSYVGKTDRCLITRLKEHSDSKDSEIFRHINSCEHFYNLNPPLVLPFNNLELLPQIVLNNTVIIDKSMNWSLLLYKEALHIHRQHPELNHWTKASKELVIFN